MPVTGIVHTKNEERDIARVLSSLRQVCDRLLVADMASSDRTREIAALEGAEVLQVPDFGYADPAWAMAVDHADSEWVLRIDADEILPSSLAARLREVIEGDEADVVEMGRQNFMFGEPLNGSGWAPESDRHFFLFKPAFLESVSAEETSVHTVMRPLTGARVLRLEPTTDLSVWHFNYADWTHFVDKLNRYTSIEAADAARSGKGGRARDLVIESVRQIGWRGIRRQAWRDGYRGAGLVWLMVTYRVVVYLKTRQLREVGDADSIRSRYNGFAREVASK